jgi:hypothetical protein
MDEQKPRRGPGRPSAATPPKGSYSYRADKATKAQADAKAEAEGTTLSRLIEGWITDYAAGRHSSQ